MTDSSTKRTYNNATAYAHVKGTPDRLRLIADKIEEFPEHFDMNDFVDGPLYDRAIAIRDFDQDSAALALTLEDLQAAPCGTTACIGGWACNLWPAEVKVTRSATHNARDILGLQSDGLFYDESLFRQGENRDLSDEEYVRMVANRLRAMADQAEA